MAEYFLYAVDNGNMLRKSEDVLNIPEFLGEGYSRVWLDIQEPDGQSMQILTDHFGIHVATLKELNSSNGRPQLFFTEDYACLVFQRIFYNFKTESSEPREFIILFNTHWVITLHKAHLGRTFRSVRMLVEECPSETILKSTGYVVFQVLELVLRDYAPVIDEWQESLDTLEHSALKGSGEVIMQQILQFKKLVTHMRRSLSPQREVLNRLFERSRQPYADAETKALFKITVDDLIHLLHEVESLSTHAGSVFEIYATVLALETSEASNKLNLVMQRLNVITCIFLPLSFVVGVYGMNIPDMPEVHIPHFYVYLWLFMGTVTIGMLYMFKKLKWF